MARSETVPSILFMPDDWGALRIRFLSVTLPILAGEKSVGNIFDIEKLTFLFLYRYRILSDGGRTISCDIVGPKEDNCGEEILLSDHLYP